MKSSTIDSVFVDTSFFKALLDSRDDFHLSAVKIWDKLKIFDTFLVTSNYVLDETFTLVKQRCGRKIVHEFRKKLADGFNFRIIRVTIIDERKAWQWFLKDWSRLSFTDCVSFAIMERLKIKRVATFDAHFSRAGFEIAR